MRWLANLVLVFLSLVALFFLVNDHVNYEFIGNVILNPVFGSGSCSLGYYQNLWTSILKESYSGVVLTHNGPDTAKGNCSNFDLLKINYDPNRNMTLHYVYVTHDNEDPHILAGMVFLDNSSGNIHIPTTLSQRKNELYGTVPAGSAYRGYDVSNPNIEAKKYLNYPGNIDPGLWTYGNFYSFKNSTINGNTSISNTFFVHSQKNITYVDYKSERLPYLTKKTYTIPNFTLIEDATKTNAFSLKDIFDWAGTPVFDFMSDIGNAVDFVQESNFNVTIKPKPNWYGTLKANVTAQFTGSDVIGDILLSSNTFYVNVTPVNDAPTLLQEFNSKYTWTVNKNRTFEIADYFFDPDSATLNFSSKGGVHIKAVFTTTNIIFVPEYNWKGSENIIITANDSILTVSTENITLVVQDSTGNNSGSTNTAPTITNKNPSSATVIMTVGENKQFSVTATDAQTAALTYSWTINGALASSTNNIYTFSATTPGSFFLKVSASDGAFVKDEQWSITVQAAGSNSQGTSSGGAGIDTGLETIVAKEDNKLKILLIIIGIVVFCVIVAILIIVLLKSSKKNKENVTVVSSEMPHARHLAGQKKSYFETLKYDDLTQVVNFIKKYRARGASTLDIKEALLKKGWKINQINEAFERSKF